MDTENNMGAKKGMGACHLGGGMCGNGCGCGQHHMHILKWFVKVALVVMALCFAFKIGEWKGMVQEYMHEGGQSHGSMMYRRGGSTIMDNSSNGGDYQDPNMPMGGTTGGTTTQ